jgi:outer membrane protein assembly factor BamB
MWIGKHRAQDHLSDYWNALVRNAPPQELARRSEAIDPANRTAIERVQAIHLRHRPDPVFANNLETDLMNTFARSAGTIPLPRPYPGTPNGRSAPERSPWLPDIGLGRRRAHWALASFATALIILLAGIGGYFLYENRTDQPAIVVQPATPEATPGSGWTHFKGNAARSGVANAGPTGTPIELWRVQTDGACIQPPIAVGQTVYAGCFDGILRALNVVDGSEIWRFDAGSPLDTGLSAAGDLVYVIDYFGTLHAVDSSTGSEVWRFGSPVFRTPAIDDGLLVTGSDGGMLYGIDAATGAERWRYRVTDAGEASTPAIANGVVYAGSSAGDLVALDAETGELRWRADTPEGGTGTAAVADGVVFIGGSAPDGSSFHLAFDAESGDELWSQPLQYGTVSVRDGTGFGLNQNDQVSNVLSFDTADGSELWRAEFAPENRPIAVAGDVVYVPSNADQAIYALDAATGEELWRFDVDGGFDAPFAVTDGRLFAATTLGSIYAIGGAEDVIPMPAGETGGIVASPDPIASEEPAGVVAFVDQILADPPFQAPGGVGTDRQGMFYVADKGHNQVFVVDASGAVVATIGDESGPGQLAVPTQAVADSHGNVYVANSQADRIQKFSADGTFLIEWPVVGDEPGKVWGEAVVGDVDEHDRVWVVDWGNNRILVFDDQGELQLTFGQFGPEPGDLRGPASVALDGNGNVFVTELQSHRVSKFTTDGTFLMTFGEDHLKGPLDIAIDGEGRVYVADYQLGQVVAFGADGQFLTAFGPDGSEEATFVFPIGVGVNDAGTIVVTDEQASAVYMFEWQTLAPEATPVA